MTGSRSGDRNKVGGDRAILDRGYGYLRRGDRYTLDRWLGPQGGGPVIPPSGPHLLNGLSAYYTLDESSGNRVNSQGNHALDFGSVGEEGSVPGIINDGHYCAALGTYLNNPDSSSWAWPAGVTITGWLRINTYNLHEIGTVFSKWETNKLQALLYYNGYGTPPAGFGFVVSADGVNGVGIYDPNTPFAFNEWYFMCGWYDDTAHTVNIQVNNGTIYTAPFTGPIFHGASGALLHAYFDGTSALYGNGVLDETGIWTRALTAIERASLYNGGAGLPFSAFGSLLKIAQARLQRPAQPLPGNGLVKPSQPLPK